MNAEVHEPWLLTLQEFMASAPLERYPIKRDELETAEEYVEFLSICFSLPSPV